MKFKSYLNEGDVVQGNFSKGSPIAGMNIPKGFKSFKVKESSTGKVFRIVGIRPNGIIETLGVTDNKEVANAIAQYYTTGKTAANIRKISAVEAFGSPVAIALEKEFNLHHTEKPESLDYVKRHSVISSFQLKKLEKELGYKLKQYEVEDLFRNYDEDFRPLDTLLEKPSERDFILSFGYTGDRYLVETGGHNYIRFWTYIKE